MALNTQLLTEIKFEVACNSRSMCVSMSAHVCAHVYKVHRLFSKHNKIIKNNWDSMLN